jgi:curved DNA-binding protein CbpA
VAEAALLMEHPGDYYRVLGVTRDASTHEIRRAYRRLARQHHPDRNPQPDGPERFRALVDAYAVLNDPSRRARYDHILQPPARRDIPRATRALFTRCGVLELSPREARLAATTSLTFTTAGGLALVLPAGVAEGDQVTIGIGDVRAALTIRVNSARRGYRPNPG